MKYSAKTLEKYAKMTGKGVSFWETAFANYDDDYGMVSPGDDDYPFLIDGNGNPIELGFTVKRDEEKTTVPNRRGAPHLLLYRGDISLLNKDNYLKNVAVIGLLDPTEDIAAREASFVEKIVKKGGNIVSGLALGCDTVAHRACMDNGGKTIAVLPSRLDNILPKENRGLAEEIVEKGGLLVTEYYNEPVERYELSARYIERDRLQAFFSNSIVLTASYRHPEKNDTPYPLDGLKRDSGSRHAMKIAGENGRKRYVLYNEKTDADNQMFDLNRDLLAAKDNPAIILTESALDEMIDGEMPGALPLFG